MSEEAAFKSMGDTLMNGFGEDATFIPAAGDPVSLKAHLREELVMQPTGYESRAWQGEKRIEFILDDIGREPNRGERFVIGSTTYTVQGVIENNDGVFCKVAVA